MNIGFLFGGIFLLIVSALLFWWAIYDYKKLDDRDVEDNISVSLAYQGFMFAGIVFVFAIVCFIQV
jgi:uncharacterized membrane protein YobD (UPF0266 family)